MNRSLLKRVLVFVLWLFSLLSLLPTFAVCEVQTVTHSVRQTFGGSQSPDDARIAAVARAKREALEMAGTYVESLTVVKNAQVEKDMILVLTAGVVQAEVISQKHYHTADAFGIEVVVRVIVDTAVLEERVGKLLKDRTHLEQLKQARQKEKELLEKMARLEEENRRLMAEKKSSERLKERFQEASQWLTAVEWFDKAAALWDTNARKFADPGKAIEYLNQAISLKPDYAEAYYNRGWIYGKLGQYHREIEDCNQAIRLKPDFARAYVNRGVAYDELGQRHRAIEDYNQAISLKPDLVEAYGNRGSAYGQLGQHHRAIEDYNQAIRMKPDYALAYNNRGVAYIFLGKQNLGCLDLRKACELGDCKGIELVKNMGYCR